MNDNTEIIASLFEAETPAFLDRINEPLYKASEMPLSYRSISHWHSKGLLPYQQEIGKWRLFSMTDYIWILFVNRLRNLNIGLQSVAMIKEQCFKSLFVVITRSITNYMFHAEPGNIPQEYTNLISLMQSPDEFEALQKELDSAPYRLFSFWLMLAIKHKTDVLIRIQPDKENTVDFVSITKDADNAQALLQSIATSGGLFISMYALLNEFYGSTHFAWEENAKVILDKEARTIIALMREKGLKQVVIKLDEGTVKHVQTEKKEQHMSQEEFNNAIISKKFIDYRIVINENEKLIVSAKQNFRIKDGLVSK